MKGLFIPDITAEMFRSGCLECIEALMAEGEIYDIDYEPEIKTDGDTISRQAAIDAADRADYTLLAVEDVKLVTDEVIKEIKKLPSAQPEPKWIPVEYRPPEFGKEVLISHKGTVSIDWLTQSEGSAYFFMSGAGIADIDAWMPIPKPYERSKE